jgi:predicted RND superfamily exporter protein
MASPFGWLAERVAHLTTQHDLLVIAVVLALTGVAGAGLPMLDMADQTAIDDEVFNTTEVGDGLQYLDRHYLDDEETAVSSVYVRPDGNALSRASLAETLAYQERVLDNATVAAELTGEAIQGPPTLVGTQLAGEDASVAEQRQAIEAASEDELHAAIRETLGDPVVAGRYMPESYEPGSLTAESMRTEFAFEVASVTQQQEPLPDERAQQALYDAAADRPAVFTMGTVAQAEWSEQQIADVFLLVVPPALLLVVAVLAFAYRDLVDVILGFTGVCVSVLWFFGILGWLGIPAGFASIVGPVLIVALSIDFGLHVFMRHREERAVERRETSNERTGSKATREQREDGDSQPAAKGIEPAMRRSTSSVMVAFLLVAVTAGVGFLANITNPVGFIRAFGLVITLGVLAAVFVFVTLVPALKVRVDTMLESRGIDRHKTALGTSGSLKPLLGSGVTLAQRGAAVVVVVALVAGGAGLLTYDNLDRQGFQESFVTEDDWQTDLPDPVGWSAHETEFRQNQQYVRSNFRSDDDRERRTTFLVRGDVTDPRALEAVHRGTRAADESRMTFKQDGDVSVISPLSLTVETAIADREFAALLAGVAESDDRLASLLSSVAEENPAFAERMAETTPAAVDGDLTLVYDALYDSHAETSAILERTDGSYESMRLVVPVKQGLDVDERGQEMHDIAGEMETEGYDVVPVDFATVANAGLGEIADSIIWTMALAFAGIALVLAATYRVERGTATLGIVTVVPIVLVVGAVFASMALLGLSLTFITAFLVSITIGLGIDYNIHISDRFAHELADGADPIEALSTTVTGTGGALLGSALTSGAAFATLLVHPSVVFQSFGFIVVVALALSFVVSVLVFPSMLLLWARAVGR